MDAREALVALKLIEHVGPVRVRQLLERFGEAPQIFPKRRHIEVGYEMEKTERSEPTNSKQFAQQKIK